jgi:mercuric ion transport protein
MVRVGKHLWAGAVAAIIGSLCCVGPLVLLALGVSGAWIGQLTMLERYRPLFIGLMLVFLSLAFRQLYRVPQPCAPGDECANPRYVRRQRQTFWIVVVGLTLLVTFPWFAPLVLS